MEQARQAKTNLCPFFAIFQVLGLFNNAFIRLLCRAQFFPKVCPRLILSLSRSLDINQKEGSQEDKAMFLLSVNDYLVNTQAFRPLRTSER